MDNGGKLAARQPKKSLENMFEKFVKFINVLVIFTFSFFTLGISVLVYSKYLEMVSEYVKL